MRQLSSEQVREWCAEPLRKMGDRQLLEVLGGPVRPEDVRGHMGESARAVRRLGDMLVGYMGNCDYAVVHVFEWGIWRDELLLYEALLSMRGLRGLPDEWPGLQVWRHDFPWVESFVRVAALSGWGVRLIDGDGITAAEVNHDGFLLVRSTDPAVLERARADLKDFEP